MKADEDGRTRSTSWSVTAPPKTPWDLIDFAHDGSTPPWYLRGDEACHRHVRRPVELVAASKHLDSPTKAYRDVYYWMGDDLCKRGSQALFQEMDLAWKSRQWQQPLDAIREENRQREAKNLPSLELGVRSFAQRAFGTAKRASRNFKFTVQRGDSWSDFMQFMWLATQSGWSPAPWVMDWDDPGFDGKSPEFHVVFKVQGKEQPGMDAGGLRRELLQGVLLSALAPKDVENDGYECIRHGLRCLDVVNQTNYLLQQLPSGYAVPPIGEINASASTSTEIEVLYSFLGQFLARAYVISTLTACPVSLHPLIYESSLKGHAVQPQHIPHYSSNDTIEACENLASILGRRSGVLETYGWQKCDGVKDPVSKRYTQASCYEPLYRDMATWEHLYVEWGEVAPDGVQPTDLVPSSRAREYTELKCQHRWHHGFEKPVDKIVEGFREHIHSQEFWDHIPDGASLKRMVEGHSQVDMEGLLSFAKYTGNWTTEDKQVLKDALDQLGAEHVDETMPIIHRPVNQFLHFFTGSFSDPPKGWETNPAQFGQLTAMPVCAHLEAHTCFNQLLIPKGCFKDTTKFLQVIKESFVEAGYNMA